MLTTLRQEPASNSMPGLKYPAANTKSPPGITVEGGSSTRILPQMDPYGPKTRWVDIYSASNSTSTFTITSDPWITASPSSGTLKAPGDTSDQRVLVSVDWKSAPEGISTTSLKVVAGTTNANVSIPLLNSVAPPNYSGFVESDKTIAIEPEHFSSSTSSSTAQYQAIPGYGRTLSGVTLFPVSISTQTPPDSPKLTYNLYLFTSTTANITVFLGTSLNTDPSRPLAYAIAIDDETPVKAQYVPITQLGTLPSTWSDTVKDATAKYSTRHAVTAGAHVLSLWLLESGVVVQKIVVDLGGVRTSYLGPGESMRVNGTAA